MSFSGGWRSPWRACVPAVVVLGALLIGGVVQLRRAEAAGRADLRSRFALRARLTADFAHSFARELQTREVRQARRWLAGSSISRRAFAELSSGFGFDAAVLLDQRGRVLAAFPHESSLQGERIAPRYPHLRTAIAGRPAISPIVLSAARHEPIVASAVPYRTRFGRRVFSGGFRVAQTPLTRYLRTAASLPGSAFALVDKNGNAVVGTRSRTLVSRDVRGDRPGWLLVRRRVANTPWQIVAAVPTLSLYRPLRHRTFTSWLILSAFAGASTLAVLLLYRLSRKEQELRLQATSDPLTHVWNRRALEAAFEQRQRERARYGGGTGALLLLDLDDFKQINDTLGHAAGDTVLCRVADALRDNLRSSDWIARLGGDEFVIFLPVADANAATHVRDKIEDAIGSIRWAVGRSVRASVGTAIETEATTRLSELLSEADTEMYGAKQTRSRRRQHRQKLVTAGR